MTNKNYYALIMAGGVGSRFWPVSTKDYPKQFHDMLGIGHTLLQLTFNRLSKLVDPENILIATNERYKDLVLEQLPQVKEEQLFLEPAMRNTAPCILFTALKIKERNEDAVMIVAPSDHFIENENEFIKNINTAFKACQEDDILMTLGIRPENPNTGYGYIEYEKGDNDIKKVVKFTEKPDEATAKKFISAGNYLWNAGIFIWSVKSIVKSFENSLPRMYELFIDGKDYFYGPKETGFIKKHYPQAENISVDYGIMQQADNIYTLPVDFGWNDLGTWSSLYEKLKTGDDKNVNINSKVLAVDARNNIICSTTGKHIVVQGLDDFIIVEKEDVLLICPKDREQGIKQLAAKVKEQFGDEFV